SIDLMNDLQVDVCDEIYTRAQLLERARDSLVGERAREDLDPVVGHSADDEVAPVLELHRPEALGLTMELSASRHRPVTCDPEVRRIAPCQLTQASPHHHICLVGIPAQAADITPT